MAAKTYMELVNRTIDECKITLDPLTSANFDDPPRTAMYNRIKRWVVDAYEELMTTRNEWFSRVERANIDLYPRIHLTDCIVSPLVGYTYRGSTSLVEFTVRAVWGHEDVEGDIITEYTVDVEFADDANYTDMFVTESLDIISPAPTAGAARVKGQGYYDFSAMVPSLEHITENSMRLYPAVPDEPTPFNQFDAGLGYLPKTGSPVYYIAWDDFWSKRNNIAHVYGSATPYYMTRTSLGSYVLLPALDRKVLASFEYTRVITPMVEWDDTPEALPEKYHLYLVWRAARSFADFDGNGRLFSRVKKEEDKYLMWMERDESPEVTMGSNRFYVR